VVSAATYGAAWVQEAVWVIPPWSWWSALPVSLAFAMLWFGVDRLESSDWLCRRKQPVEPGDDLVSTDPSGAALPQRMI